MPASASSKEGGTSSRRSPYVSKACAACRRKKSKCDGGSPCKPCKQHGLECSYAAGVDARRAVGKDYVAALETRCQVLEGVVRELQAKLDALPPSSTSPAANTGGRSPAAEPLPHALTRLRLDEATLEYHLSGPSSILQHFPSAPSVRTSSSPAASTASSAGSPFPLPLPAWSRVFPFLPGWDQELHDTLVLRYFRFFNDFYNFVDEKAFRSDMELALSQPEPSFRTSSYSSLLHLAIVAQGAWFSDDPRTQDESVVESLITRAHSLVLEEGDRPMLSTVQGLLVVANYFTCAAKPNVGYLVVGSAFRLCIALGLNLDCSSMSLDASYCANRERTFWACYLSDKLWSSYTGRDPVLSFSSVSLPLPAVDNAADIASWVAPTAAALSPVSQPPPPASSFITSAFRYTVRLSILQEQIMQIIYGSSVALYSPTVLSKVTEINVALETWSSDLPSALRVAAQTVTPPPPHVTILNMYCSFLVLLLHRPYYIRHNAAENLPINDTASKRCISAANRIVSLLRLYSRSPTLRYTPVALVQFTFLASTTLLLTIIQTEHGPQQRRAESARASLVQCVRALRVTGKPCRVAGLCAEIVVRLAGEWCASEIEGLEEEGTEKEGEEQADKEEVENPPLTLPSYALPAVPPPPASAFSPSLPLSAPTPAPHPELWQHPPLPFPVPPSYSLPPPPSFPAPSPDSLPLPHPHQHPTPAAPPPTSTPSDAAAVEGSEPVYAADLLAAMELESPYPAMPIRGWQWAGLGLGGGEGAGGSTRGGEGWEGWEGGQQRR
ncbi:hypothetical protein JCM6882_007858 [Rhodosporidiobolus microsporus]